MPNIIPELQKNNISTAMFLDLTLNGITHYISTAYTTINLLGNDYLEQGSLLTISDIDSHVKTSSGEIQISLSGVPNTQDFMTAVLNTPIRGGEVIIRRGFFDPHTQEISEVYDRFSGLITNYNISEDYDASSGEFTNTITISCSSINSLLDSSISGQRTSPDDRRRYYPGDISFDRVPQLQNTQFDFGREYSPGTISYPGSNPAQPGNMNRD